MAAPRPFVVVLIVALTVMVGIYILGLGIGLQGTRAPSLDDLKRQFGEARKLRLEELTLAGSAACAPIGPGRLRIPAETTCELVAGKARPWQRRAIVLTSAASLRFLVTPDDDQGVVVEGNTDDLEDRTKPVRFAVPSAGARISITCAPGPSPCLLAFQ